MLFALLNKSKILGLFDDYDSCTNMLVGLSSHGFLKENDMEIVAYESNSIKLVKPVDIFCSDTDESSVNNETTDSEKK